MFFRRFKHSTAADEKQKEKRPPILIHEPDSGNNPVFAFDLAVGDRFFFRAQRRARPSDSQAQLAKIRNARSVFYGPGGDDDRIGIVGLAGVGGVGGDGCGVWV
jgi:hypothetical protein